MNKKLLMILCFLLVFCILLMPTNAYVLQNRYWEDGKSALQMGTNVNSSYHSVIKNAANSWNNASGSSFYFYNNSNTSLARTVVQMGGMPDPAWLAYESTQIVSGNYKRLSCIFFDNSRLWGNTTLLHGPIYYDIETTAIHELGHAAGLSHSNSNGAVMYPTTPTVSRVLKADDILGIKTRYPSSKSSFSLNSYLNSFSNDKVVQLEINPLIESMTEEEMEERADLIVYGIVKEVFPAQWDTPNGSDPSIRTKNTFSTEGYLLYHDTLIEVEDVYKGDLKSKEIYVRTVGGSTDKVKMDNDDSASYHKNEKVILYLFKDNGTRSQNLGPEHYFAYPKQGQLFIKNDKTIVNGYGNVVNPEKSLFMNEITVINMD